MQLLKPSEPKSRKRRAAEEALEARFARSSSCGASAAAPCCSAMDAKKRIGGGHMAEPVDGVTISACEGRCDSSHQCAWESMPLRLPHMRLSDSVWSSPPAEPRDSMNGGGSSSCGALFGICDVMVVDREEDMAEALQRLRESMRDAVVGLDLEWRPDGRGCWNSHQHKRSSNQVALLQLSTSSLCVLVRICKIGYRLPQCLQKFLRRVVIFLPSCLVLTSPSPPPSSSPSP